MPAEFYAAVRTDIPGSVVLSIIDTPGAVYEIWRQDGAAEAAPVRNVQPVAANGFELVTDHEAPLGRPVSYTLTDPAGQVVATAGPVTCPPIGGGKALLRSVLRPQVGWMVCEPQDETGVTWRTSTTVHEIVGSDTPIVIGEVRQRRAGVMTFLCRSIAEADQMVGLMRDGAPLLLRHDPCAAAQVRDLLFYSLEVKEARWQRGGWRLIAVNYQATKFVAGPTDEAPLDWDFAALAASANTFGELAGQWRNFGHMATSPRPPVVP